MKANIFNGNAYHLIKESQNNGTFISFPFAIYGNKDNDRQKEVRAIFNKYDYCRTDEEVEDAIFALNDMCEESETKITEPFANTDIDYVIDFENGIKACINIADEYYGRGESEYSISVNGFIVTDNVTNEQVENVAKWLDKAFNG